MLSRRFNLVYIFITILLLSCSSFVNALPIGSYQESCTNCNLQFNQLSCMCKDKHQFTRPTSIQDVNACPYIQNIDGQLQCLPPGSYSSTCNRCHMVGNYLTCNCSSMDQNEIPSSLSNAMYCNNITNQNGRLVCSGGYRHHFYPLPAGNYAQTCSHCHYNGRRLSCRCQKRDGSWRHTRLYQANFCQSIQNINGHLQCLMLKN